MNSKPAGNKLARRTWTPIAIAGFTILMLFSLLPSNCVSTQTYNVTIKSSTNIIPIIMDGVPTGFSTPHTFYGLSGVHNITVPYEDDFGYLFSSYTENSTGEWKTGYLNTINISSTGTYWIHCDPELNLTSPNPAPARLLLTPKDSAVIAAASNKSLEEMVDFAASLLRSTFTGNWQFPNQTLVNGSEFTPDYSTLLCSMLLARSYRAYLVYGITQTPATWVVVDLNGKFTPINPYHSWSAQQTINFSTYEARFFVDVNGVYLASEVTPISTPPPTPTPTATPTASPNPSPTPTSIIPEFPSIGIFTVIMIGIMVTITCLKKKDFF